ncbi:MAG TPA: sulfite exporter TauE/SafE family protein [Candidatus Nanopelagicales bacterium]|nr:sulfite exporter TauE/SafE family protein [Candidatus Nanopelagicales bacterium]
MPGTTSWIRVRVPVQGMTCAACERRVGKALAQVPGVRPVAVSARSGLVTLDVDGEVPWEGVVEALEGTGYTVGRSPWFSHEQSAWVRAAGALLAVGAIVWVVSTFAVGDLSARITAAGSTSLLVVLLIGLTAGFSTCMALVGGLVLAVSAARMSDGAEPAGGRWRPQLAFQAGRIGGFFVLGALLGALGARLALPTPAVAGLMAVVAVFMVLLGIRLTGLSPRLSGWSLALPGSWGARLGLDDRARGPYSDLRAAGLGVATFVLPCGFTQVVQLYAMTTANPLQSGLVMAVFAIGTAPGLLLVGGLPSFATGARRALVLSVAGVALVCFAVVNLSAAASLVGLTGSGAAAATAKGVSSNVVLKDGVQVVTMNEGSRGYAPADTVVYAGVPIRWQIEAESQFTCAAAIRGVGSDFSVDLKTGPNVVELPAMQPGTFSFVCAMGMYSGSLTAIDAPKPASSL